MGSIIGWHCEDCGTGESLFLGRWCLDDVRFSHDAPGKGYDDSLRCWVRWGEVVTLTDDRIQKIIHGRAFQNAIAERGMHHDGDDIELHGAVDVIAKIIRGDS